MIQNIVTTIIIKPTQSRYVLIPQSLNVVIATRDQAQLKDQAMHSMEDDIRWMREDMKNLFVSKNRII